MVQRASSQLLWAPALLSCAAGFLLHLARNYRWNETYALEAALTIYLLGVATFLACALKLRGLAHQQGESPRHVRHLEVVKV